MPREGVGAIIAKREMREAAHRDSIVEADGAKIEVQAGRQIVRYDEVVPGRLVRAARCTGALAWVAVEEQPFTLHTEAPIGLRRWRPWYVMREVEIVSGGRVSSARCTGALAWVAVEEQPFTFHTEAPIELL